MLKITFALLTGALFIQIMNILYMRYSGVGALSDVFKVVLATLPLQIMASMAFAYYYSQGIKIQISYFYLSIFSIAASMIGSFFVTSFILKSNDIKLMEVCATIITMVGIGLFLYAKISV
jgi:hypothetical protein